MSRGHALVYCTSQLSGIRKSCRRYWMSCGASSVSKIVCYLPGRGCAKPSLVEWANTLSQIIIRNWFSLPFLIDWTIHNYRSWVRHKHNQAFYRCKSRSFTQILICLAAAERWNPVVPMLQPCPQLVLIVSTSFWTQKDLGATMGYYAQNFRFRSWNSFFEENQWVWCLVKVYWLLLTVVKAVKKILTVNRISRTI